MAKLTDPLEVRVGIVAARRLAKRAAVLEATFGQLRVDLEEYAEDMERLLPEFAPFPEPALNVEIIIKAVVAVSQLRSEELLGQGRNQVVLLWRDVAVYIIRHYMAWSYPKIAEVFDKDHSTMVTAYKRATRKMQEDRRFQQAFADVADVIGILA